MKIFLLTVCLLVFIFRSTAQEVDEKAFYQQRFEKFKRIKNLGIGLTAVGGVALAVGLVLHANNDRQDFTSNPYSYQKEEAFQQAK